MVPFSSIYPPSRFALIYKSKIEDPSLRMCGLFNICGFIHGFILQYTGERSFGNADNLKSAYEFSLVLKRDITREIKADRINGPFSSPPFLNFKSYPKA